jgi:preprotein translocase subunit SecG
MTRFSKFLGFSFFAFVLLLRNLTHTTRYKLISPEFVSPKHVELPFV